MIKKIAISCKVLGGIGGQERNIFCTIRSLENHIIDVYTKQIVSSELFPISDKINIYLPKLIWRKMCFYFNPFKNYRNREYDIYIHYYGAKFIADHVSCKKKFLIPSGNNVGAIEEKFDYVLSQTPDGKKYINNHKKHVLLPPPVLKTSSLSVEVKIPKKYYLTVFNPYVEDRIYEDGFKPCKGYDILYKLADHLPYPLVWCHSLRTINSSNNIHLHKNIIHIDNPKQGELRYLYENTLAYVCFSREEGFGWSIAGALLYQKPIISKYIGVLQLYGQQKGLYIFETFDQLLEIVKIGKYDHPNYVNSYFDPKRFRKKLFSLL